MSPVNRRRYFRTTLKVPATWAILTAEEIEWVRQGSGDRLFKREGLPSPIDEFLEQAAPGSQEEQLLRCLQLISSKLDLLIEQMFLPSGEKGAERDTVLDLSGSGLKLATQQPLQKDDLLKMSLLMPGTFQYQIDLVVRVVRVEQEGNLFLAAAEYVEIEEAAREAIIKVVFQKQRRELRQERTRQEDQGES